MAWKPKHETHSIERVRLLFVFREPLPRRVLQRSSSAVTEKFSELGFNSVESAESVIPMLNLNFNTVQKSDDKSLSGVVMRRHEGGTVAEEVGIRDLNYGYMTTAYDRWEGMIQRLGEVLLPALDVVNDVAELDRIMLEYWNKFFFDGEPSRADVSNLLGPVDPAIPKDVLNGSSLWHTHAGWFEGQKDFPTLINRNIDIIDNLDENGRVLRELAIHTVVEKRSTNVAFNISSVREEIQDLHDRSSRIVRNTITEDFRRRIGMNEEVHK